MTAFPKPRPHILIKREQRAAKTALDTQERKACHVRSGGRCEVVEVLPQPERSLLIVTRCKGRAVHNHHLISGVGRRNVGVSVLASHRIDCCQRCHQDIEAGLLVPADRDHATVAGEVQYERRYL